MTRPLTRPQLLENKAFLKALERNGNVRLAAREVGAGYGKMQHRRKHHPAFAARWDAVLAVAQARLADAGGLRGPRGSAAASPAPPAPSSSDEGVTNPGGGSPPATHRTRGGESVVVRRNDGKYQVRAAQPGKLTQACEQAFLAALSATANVRLSAAAAGASVAAFYRRRRKNPAFAREMRLALEQGYERIEMALLAGMTIEAHEDDAWRNNEPPEMPRMTIEQALQLMYLHQKEARLLAEPTHLKRRRGETQQAQSYRFRIMYELGIERAAEQFRVAEAARAAAAAGRSPHEPPAPSMPALDQVTGWSKASGKPPHHEGRALFGGWRLGDLKGKG